MRRKMLTPSDQLLISILIGVLLFGIANSNESSPAEDCSFSLDLTNAGLRNLPGGFVKNEYLTRLTLDGNEISTISSAAFSFAPRLSHLSLARNKLAALDLRLFSELENLKTLNLNENCKLPTTRVPRPRNYPWGQEDLYQYDTTTEWYRSHIPGILNVDSVLPNLTHLSVENNNLRGLEFGFGKLPMLTHLYLSDNSFEMNENTMFSLSRLVPNLTHLHLQKCGIDNLNISPLSTLTLLDVKTNNIHSICNEYCEVSYLKLKGAEKLETLLISWNQISKIETDSFNCTRNLLKLDLSENRIHEIREGTFDKLDKLRFLSLKNNPIILSSVNTFRGLISLEELSLEGNDLSFIPIGLFENLSVLKKLLLNRARISSIDSKIFSKLSHLEVLSLAGNRLSIIPDGSMPNSGSFVNLNLENNKFTSMSDIPLSDMPNLDHLSLRCNPLKTISVQTFLNASETLIIDLEQACDSGPPRTIPENNITPDPWLFHG